MASHEVASATVDDLIDYADPILQNAVNQPHSKDAAGYAALATAHYAAASHAILRLMAERSGIDPEHIDAARA